MTEGDEEVGNESDDNTRDTQSPSEYNTRAVAVANCPANEVWMCLSAQGILHGHRDTLKRGWVSGMLECMQDGLSFSGRKVQLARTAFSNVDANDPGYLISVWLGGD